MIGTEALRDRVVEALEEAKAEELAVLDVRDRTTITVYMIVATGRSDRHVRGISDRVREVLRACPEVTVAEEASRDWVLLDIGGDVLLHIMLPETRVFYSLEKLWTMPMGQGRPEAP